MHRVNLSAVLAACCATLSAAAPRPAAAQRPTVAAFAPAHPTYAGNSWQRAAVRVDAGADSGAAIPPTHWKEGGLILGGVFGLLGAIAAVELCGYDTVCHAPVLKALAGFALGGLTGFGVGALIGGQFPKHDP